MSVVAAIDCGASSVRVCRVDLAAPTLAPEVIHRVVHTPRHDAKGHLRWDWSAITAAVVEGLERCLAIGPIESIGVDTWAVDYGLLDEEGRLLSDPYCYRDHRTDGYRSLVDEFGAAEMYRINGLQLQPFNTVFQLAVHDRDELRQAARLLWLPELIAHQLTGVAVTERTSAGSSGLIDVTNGGWSSDLLELSGVGADLVGTVESAGRVIGAWRDIPVSLVAGHDTASAVVGMGPSSPGGSAFVSSGTWMLAGVERAVPDTSEWARTRNYTNEASALTGFRFLRNVTGFWLLEQCRPAWGSPDVGELIASAESVTDDVPIVDVDDERFRVPEDMLTVYTDATGLGVDASPARVTRSIIESVAARTADVIVELAQVQPIDDVVLFGGAARMSLLVRRLRDLTGREVRVGAAEAAAAGNAVVQGVAIGVFDTIDDAWRRFWGDRAG